MFGFMLCSNGLAPDRMGSTRKERIELTAGASGNKVLTAFGLEVDPDMKKVPARVLPQPIVKQAGQALEGANFGRHSPRCRAFCW